MEQFVPDTIRTRIEQRLVIGRRHVPITGLNDHGWSGTATTLASIRSALMALTRGSQRWADCNSIEAAASTSEMPAFETPSDLCRILCGRVQSRSTHVDSLDDGVERFSAWLSIKARERLGVTLPHVSDTNPAYCRHFATTVARAYRTVTERVERFPDTAVLVVMGLPRCDAEIVGKLHAWNWLVDFERGTIAAFDPQDERSGDGYANVSALLFTLAVMRADDVVRGLRLLVRRHDSIHGGTVLFHLARHPIDRGSRWKIAARLRAANFQRIVPSWQQELEVWDRIWRREKREVAVGEIVRFADE